MYSDEMNKIEVRNVEKYPLFTVFYEVFFSTGNHNILIKIKSILFLEIFQFSL